jgi:transposase-like protein
LTSWPVRRYHLSFRKKLLNTFGAHRYRCPACRYNFLSFRPYAGGKLTEAVEELRGAEP